MNYSLTMFLNKAAKPQIEKHKNVDSEGNHKGLPIWLQRSAALFGLMLLSPLLLIVVALIKLESRGSCFYSQDRIGKFGRHFKMYKFRSMYLSSDPKYTEPDPTQSDRDGVCKKYRNDPRITKVGAFIRKFSIDELPQLFNVARGDMALIGPRPALSIEVDAYPTSALGRLNGVPGLSGLWQVSGRADTDFSTQVLLDNDYLNQQSIWLDMKILILTVPCVVAAKGAY
ncbi:sugar transferase [Paraglaciecola aquimarina]|uniref:Sugar transferase n=1 Tax=Paraglaciecola algarum TaxID=3050085 RepID=A0ABS9DF57_9ALTE|nr:sugar transferase [Paraglaciecola sp. G1-23]MCF2950424.1 sugar transferase [Paraglaciecola sp. G1-23]